MIHVDMNKNWTILQMVWDLVIRIMVKDWVIDFLEELIDEPQ